VTADTSGGHARVGHDQDTGSADASRLFGNLPNGFSTERDGRQSKRGGLRERSI
jgi:hypothetical protein